MELLDSLKRERPALHVWDPFPILCPGTMCSAYDDGDEPLYFDFDHLSGHGNRILAPSFIEALLAIWRQETQP
jgi:hypothetical protein